MLPVWLALIGEGFLVKFIASFDDTLTRIPIISHLTKTYRGRIAFSLGTLLALTVIIIIALFFSEVLLLIPHTRIIVSGLIFLLALSVYFELFSSISNRSATPQVNSASSRTRRALSIISAGFVVSFITLLDDVIVLIPLFLGGWSSKFWAVVGIYLAAIIQILFVIYFGKRMEKIPFKKEMAAGALLVLAVLVFTGIV